MFTELEWVLKSSVKATEAGLYSTMAQVIIEESPQNGKELFDAIGKHLADAPDSYNRAMKKLFTDLFKNMDAKKLIGAKKEKKVEEKKVSSDDEDTKNENTPTPSRKSETETDASEQGTPSMN
jgi:preprotein translocase subunit Sec63